MQDLCSVAEDMWSGRVVTRWLVLNRDIVTEQANCNARLCRNKTDNNTRCKVIYAQKAIVSRDTQPFDCDRHSRGLVACMK